MMENRTAFVEENVGLVRSLVPRFLGRGMEYDDLFQAGCIGLVKAADHFDPALGYKFSTYAVPVILGEMRRLFRDNGAVKVSRSLKELSLKAARTAEKLEMESGSAPTVAELAAELGVSEERCAEALNAGLQPVSLTNEEDDSELDIPVESHEERISDRLALRQVMEKLPEKDRRLLE
ncbi:MAG: sigma-70 family RNA polymerase sigma factor, partial [Clostridia bacterium]|nr:sigma-70 family RNA polymerase sigma factor [Clostridia bacterium]